LGLAIRKPSRAGSLFSDALQKGYFNPFERILAINGVVFMAVHQCAWVFSSVVLEEKINIAH
jgi:hypothetical protein